MNQRVEAMISTRRMGQFRLRTDLVRDNVAGTLQLMSHTLVVQAVFDPTDGCFAYVAYSEYFDQVAVGDRAPEYLALFSGSGKGKFLGFTRRGWVGDERRVGAAEEGGRG